VHLEGVTAQTLSLTSNAARSATALPTLEALYRAHAAAVFTLSLRLCASRAEAEDVTQETFLEAGRSLATFRFEGSIEGWLKRVCASKALMRLRQQRHFPEVELPEDGGEHTPSTQSLDSVLLTQVLAQLPDVTRAVVWMHDVEGYTHEQIGELLNQSAGFSASQLCRAHQRLRTFLTEKDETP